MPFGKLAMPAGCYSFYSDGDRDGDRIGAVRRIRNASGRNADKLSLGYVADVG
jgi:hypothetical protein